MLRLLAELRARNVSDADKKPVSSQETYRRFARYYDWYVRDFDADLPLYRALCAPEHRVLEIGCGTGRVLRPLLETRCRVTGVDISEEMLSVAEAKLKAYVSQGKLKLKKHDFRLAPLGEQYDRIFVTFYTFNYLLSKEEQERFLGNVSRSLAADGLVSLDLFYPRPLALPATSDLWQREVLVAGTQEIILKEKRKMLGNVEERVQIYADGTRQDKIVTRRHYVSAAQAAALLTEAGFADLQVTTGYAAAGFRPMGKDTENLKSPFVCVGRKRGAEKAL